MYSWEAMGRCIGRHRVAVAKVLRKSAVLVSKWQEPTHDFTDSGALSPLDRLESIIQTALNEGQRRAEATAPISYLAQRFGLTVVSLPDANSKMQDMVKVSYRAIKEFGELVTAFAEAIEDGRISPLERQKIEIEGLEAVQQIVTLLQILDRAEG